MIGDFHIHTTASDGAESPLEILARVKRQGLDAFAITDHDTLEGSLSLLPVLSSQDPLFIVALELSTRLNDESVHVLGFFPETEALGSLTEWLAELDRKRLVRAERMKALVEKHFGITFDLTPLRARKSITRGSIASEIVWENPKYDKQQVFDLMIGDGCPAYLPASEITPAEGIARIHEAGGLAVLAHPTLLRRTRPEDLAGTGFDGIEAIYPQNKIGDEGRFRKLAHRNGLFITAGSDFHAPNDGRHGNVGAVTLTGEDMKAFLVKCGYVKRENA